MGTQEEERDWVDVTNDLLNKCHVNIRMRSVSDCNANVFVTLYEVILGEKVPDYIATPASQEDDIHNVQSVIDSLALDYLQISLSHITGEKIVGGHKDSIKNLLEIFDGLLEYLNEEICEEESQDEGLPVEDELCGPTELNGSQGPSHKEVQLERESLSSSEPSALQSSKHSLHSWNVEETGSANELIGLGESARTFTAKQEAAVPVEASGPGSDSVDPQATIAGEYLHSAIPLQPPYQATTPHQPENAPSSPSHSHPANGLSKGLSEEKAPNSTTEKSAKVTDTLTYGSQFPAASHSPTLSEGSVPCHQRIETVKDSMQLEPTSGGPRRVLFRTQPDVLFLTLPDEMEPSVPLATPLATDKEGAMGDNSSQHSFEFEDDGEGSLPHRRQKNMQAEQELHQMSEKLSRRLEELDQMLKRALDESREPGEVVEEDEESHHSESIMECQRTTTPAPKHTGSPRPEAASQPCTLSLSPPLAQDRDSGGQLDDAVTGLLSLDNRRQTNLTAATRTRRRERRQRQTSWKHNQLVNKAYQEELRSYEDRERAELDKERLKAQEAEREYREAIMKDIPRIARQSSAKTSSISQQHRPPRAKTTTGRRRLEYPRKATPMKVRENDLLPVLLEEFPLLHLSPRTLSRMWEQQLEQVDRLHASSQSPHSHRKHSKHSSQIEEAQRRYELLGEIIRKEQEHNRRLREFKERVQQQKLTQNRLREQRQQVARAKKYYNDYHVQLRARMMRARTKEERMFKQVFEEGLELQKALLREQRAYAREQRLEHQRRHQEQIKSMENYYKDQFSLLAETLAQERQEIQVRKNAQEKALLKMKRELHSRMEREIRELQKIIIQNDEDDFFQDLEVQRLHKRVSMASFHYNTSCPH